MQIPNRHYLLVILFFCYANLLFPMEKRHINSLKALCAAELARQLPHNLELLNELKEDVVMADSLFDFIKTKILGENLRLLLNVLPYKNKTLVGHEGPITAVKLNSKATLALTGSADTTVRLWDLQNGSCIKIFKGHPSKITALAFDEEEHYFASGSEDGTVCLWNIEEDNCIHTFPNIYSVPTISSRLWSIEFNKNLLIARNVQYTIYWDLSTKEVVAGVSNITLESGKDYCIALDPLRIAKRKVNSKTEEVISVLSQNDPSNPITCGQISRDNRLVLTGLMDGVVNLWDLQKGECLKTFNGHIGPVCAVSFSRNSTKAYTVSYSFDTHKMQIRILDIETEKEIWCRYFPSDKVPLYLKVSDDKDFYIQFHDKTGLINVNAGSYIGVTDRIFLAEAPYYSIIALDSLNKGAIYDSQSKTFIRSLDFSEAKSTAFDACGFDDTISALFGLENNNCQLWTVLNKLELEELALILMLKEKKEQHEEIEICELLELLLSCENFTGDQLKQLGERFNIPEFLNS